MANWKFFLDGNEVEEPIGWDAIEFTAIRMESHGIDQPFSTEVKFYAEGARYIKSIYDQYYINQPIAIKITSNVGYDGGDYEFNGFLNMAIYQEHNVCDTDSWEITVGIIDDQFRENFKSRMDVEIDLFDNKDVDGNTIPDADWENIRLHREDLVVTAKGGNLAQSTMRLKFDADFDLTCLCCKWDYPNYIGTFPVYWSSSDFEDPVGSTFNVQGTAYGNSNVIFKNNASYQRTVNFKVDVSGYWRGTWGLGVDACYSDTCNWEAVFRVHNGNGQYDTIYTVYTSPLKYINANGNNPPVAFSFVANIDIVVPVGYVVSFNGYWGVGGGIKRNQVTYPACTPPVCQPANIDVQTDNLCIIATEINRGDYASKCDVLRLENYFNRIIHKLTGSANKLISGQFSKSGNGCYWNNAVTNGLRIRNAITFEQADTGCGEDPDGPNKNIFKTSWQKSFENLDKIFCLGWAFEWTGSEWKIRVDKREYFYQNLVSQSFENVGEVTQYAIADKLVNHIIVGYTDNWKNQNIGGAWAIMTDRNYYIGNKAMSKNSSAKLDLRSDIITEGYAIEYSRRLQFYEPGPVSSDRPNDYELFLIWMNRDELTGTNIENTPLQLEGETGAYTFAKGTVSYPSDFIAVSNSPQKGLYNILHTPARIACRWWKVLGMHTYKTTNPMLRYQAGEYQVTYSSRIDNLPCPDTENVILYENANITPDLVYSPTYLFQPIEVEFTYPQSLCDFLTLSQDEQYKKVRLTSGSYTIEGFIQEATNQPEDASGGTTKFRLLVSNQQSGLRGAFTDGFDSGFEIDG